MLGSGIIEGMKAISVRQPWAGLIVLGVKDIENRTWFTLHRGPLLIHASKARDEEVIQRAIKALSEAGHHVTPDDFPLGGIVGQVDVIDCVQEHGSEWFDGPWGWVLENAQRLAFRPLRGKLGLFTVED